MGPANLAQCPMPAIGAPDVPPPIPEELLPPCDELLRGDLASVRLPVGSAAPTQCAWCSVSNLVAVALTPEPGSATAQILVLEPSNPEDCTALELPMAGPGDYVTSLEWSWPGQRRALLSASASGRLVAWTQPSQQGQDESVVPRCIDDWHGQLLLDVSGSAGGGRPGPVHVKPEPGTQPHGAAAGGAAHMKQEPAADADSAAAAAAAAAAGPGGVLAAEAQQQAERQQRQGRQQPSGSPVQPERRWMLPALAGACWLRQPAGGRVWSTPVLAGKRPEGCGPDGGASGGGGGESFDTVFYEPPVPGSVPHWARPHQLTAAVITADGRLTVLWALASKLPNTLSWYRSRPLHVPPPPPAAAPEAKEERDASAATDAGGDGEALPPQWRIGCCSAAALHDGSLALALVYDRRRADGVYVYGMRGNPTLGGTPVGGPAPGGGGGGPLPVPASAAALAPVIAFQALLPLREGLSVRHCRLHVAGAATRRLFVLGQSNAAAAAAAAIKAESAAAPPPAVAGMPAAVVACFRAEPASAASCGGGGAAGGVGSDGGWCGARYSTHMGPSCGGFSAAAAAVRCAWQPPAGSGPTDFTLEAGGRAFPVHRALLAARCDYFRQRLGQTDGATDTAPLPDADPNALALVLRHLYDDDGAAAAVPAPLAPAVAELADRLGCGELSAAAAGLAAAAGPRLSVSGDGAKVALCFGSAAYVLDSESLEVLAAEDLAQPPSPAPESAPPYGGELHPSSDGGHPGPSIAPPPDAHAPAAAAQPGGGDGGGGALAHWDAVPAAAACLSPHAACVCTVALRRRPRPWRLSQSAAAAAATGAAGGGAADGPYDMDVDGAVANGGGASGIKPDYDAMCHTPDDVGGGDGAGGGDEGLEDVGDDHDATDGVFLRIRTVPDAAAAAAAALEEEGTACWLDALRLAWGVLHRESLWDAAERLRCAWRGGPGGRRHVTSCLAHLDALLYGQEQAGRSALAAGVSRAKLEVLRRLPDPAAALAAADLLAAARLAQYSGALALLHNQHGETLNHPEARTIAGHMAWFVLELLTLMLAGLRVWAEEAAAAGSGSGSESTAAGFAASGGLPLIRLFPEYLLQKHTQMALLGYGMTAGKSGADGGRVPRLAMHPAIQEQLGGPEVLHRVRALLTTLAACSTEAHKALEEHLQVLRQYQQQQQQPNGGGAAGPAPSSQPPWAPVGPVTDAALQAAAKTGEMPRPLLLRSLLALFPGPFHVHCGRTKGLITPAAVAQALRQEALQPLIGMSREALLERYRALGLQQQLTDPRVAPHAAARRLWMSFRAPAPPPELHGAVLAQQHVSGRQRQRWRRQRGAALALGSSAPLWSHTQGVLPDCLTGVPLPPGTSWSLEGASAGGAVTAQMGPGVGPAGGRHGTPPLLAALQRAWVCCAAPAELGSPWKRARLGLELDIQY